MRHPVSPIQTEALTVGLAGFAMTTPRPGKLRHERAEVGSCVSDTFSRPPGVLFSTRFGYAHIHTYIYILQRPEIYEENQLP